MNENDEAFFTEAEQKWFLASLPNAMQAISQKIVPDYEAYARLINKIVFSRRPKPFELPEAETGPTKEQIAQYAAGEESINPAPSFFPYFKSTFIMERVELLHEKPMWLSFLDVGKAAVQCIKLVRDLTGASLVEAKSIVDNEYWFMTTEPVMALQQAAFDALTQYGVTVQVSVDPQENSPF